MYAHSITHAHFSHPFGSPMSFFITMPRSHANCGRTYPLGRTFLLVPRLSLIGIRFRVWNSLLVGCGVLNFEVRGTVVMSELRDRNTLSAHCVLYPGIH